MHETPLQENASCALSFGAVSASVSVFVSAAAVVAVSLFFLPHIRDVNSCA